MPTRGRVIDWWQMITPFIPVDAAPLHFFCLPDSIDNPRCIIVEILTSLVSTALLHFFSNSQIAAVREGMAWIIPVPLLSLLTAQHLEAMVCGMPDISVEILKRVVR